MRAQGADAGGQESLWDLSGGAARDAQRWLQLNLDNITIACSQHTAAALKGMRNLVLV
jgi:hypothetical protein